MKTSIRIQRAHQANTALGTVLWVIAAHSAGLACDDCAAAPLRFVVVGDTQSSTGGGIESFVPDLLDDIEARNPDFVVFPGDLVGTGTTGTFDQWNALTDRFGNNRYLVPGNHDLPGRPATNGDWQTAFDWLPNSQSVPNVTTFDSGDMINGIDQMDYYVDVSPNVRLISVTTDRDTLPGEVSNFPGYEILGGPPRALDWFQSVMSLESTKAKDHVFVFTHHPITSQSASDQSETDGIPSAWWQSIAGTNPTIDGAAADAVFTGHIHAYYPNRPDPNSDTAEVIVGTGGGGSEGVPHRQVHGFMEVLVDNGNVTTTFYGDRNEAIGGWSFTDVLDTFTITSGGGVPRGELAVYQFEVGAESQDSSDSSLSKGHALHFQGGAGRIDDPTRGSVLHLNGGGFVDAKSLGDQNLQVLGDLRIQLWAKADDRLGSDSFDNVLVAFGDADGSRTTDRGHDVRTLSDEIANYAYELSYTHDGRLRLAWEYRDDPMVGAAARREEVISSTAVIDPDEWHQIEVLRDADHRAVRFMVDGVQLGNDQPILNLPTGGGAGSLYFGALPDTTAGSLGGMADFVGRLDNVLISSESVVLPTFLLGDLNGDGSVSGNGTGAVADDDVSAFVAGWLTNTSGFSTSQKLQHGDINGDGLTDLSDWAILNSLDPTMGAAIGAALHDVPEPCSAWLLILGALALLQGSPTFRRR